MFQFFPAINNLVNVRFGTLLAAVHTLTLAVLAGGTAIGIITFRWRKILTYLGPE